MTWWLTKAQIANREQWVAALRSGEYKQGYGQLNNHGKYCCMGVACQTLDAERNTGWTDSDGYPPESVADRLGLKWDGAIADIGGGVGDDVGAFAMLNDGQGQSFAAIADLIELDTIARTRG